MAVNPEGTATDGSLDEAAKAIDGLLEPKGQPEESADQTDTVNHEEPEPVGEESPGAEPEGEQPESEEEPTHAVQVNGETQQVTLDELRNGYSRDSDYRQKTAQLADDRRQFTTGVERAANELKTRTIRLDAAINSLETTAPNLETILQEEGAEAALAADLAHRQKRQVLDEAKAERDRTAGEQQQQQQQQFQTWAQGEIDKIGKAWPEYADTEKGPKVRNDLRTYMHSVGFNDTELGGLVDHRTVLAFRKAMDWDKLQKAKPRTEKKLAAANKMAKPGAKIGSRDADRVKGKMDRLRKTGSMRDAAAVFEELL